MVKQPGHLTSMKKERGAGTRVWWRKSALRQVRDQKSGLAIAYLELVLLGLSDRRRVEKIDGEHLDNSSA